MRLPGRHLYAAKILYSGTIRRKAAPRTVREAAFEPGCGVVWKLDRHLLLALVKGSVFKSQLHTLNTSRIPRRKVVMNAGYGIC